MMQTCEKHQSKGRFVQWKEHCPVCQLEAEVERLKKIEEQLRVLMGESKGVDGLHLNGDLATWEWLVEHEWLSALKKPEVNDEYLARFGKAREANE